MCLDINLYLWCNGRNGISQTARRYISAKMKRRLAKQARGKKRMKKFGDVEIPSEAFTVMLRRDSCILKI